MHMIHLLILFFSLQLPAKHASELNIYPAISPLVADSSKIRWLDATTHNFGSIPAGKPVRKAFHFKNLTDAPLVIDNVRTTCGCTNSEWDENPVLPGAEGTVTVVYDAALPKYFKKKVIVWFAGLSKPEHVFVEGVVE